MRNTSQIALLLFLVTSLLIDLAHGALDARQQWLSSLSSFSAGAVGGICSVLVGHPFDLVKVRQQTAKKSRKKTEKGTFATLRDIVKTEGIRGMYRGVSAPLLAVAPIWAVSFWGFDTGDKLVRAFCHTTKPLTVLQLCAAGGFSALPTALVMVPCERIKCKCLHLENVVWLLAELWL
jgi:solute carrier family 25 carnitine/acylcarnitine transporter 20/29